MPEVADDIVWEDSIGRTPGLDSSRYVISQNLPKEEVRHLELGFLISRVYDVPLLGEACKSDDLNFDSLNPNRSLNVSVRRRVAKDVEMALKEHGFTFERLGPDLVDREA